MQTSKDALQALRTAWPRIKEECAAVLAGELHYQAMIYRCLRDHGKVPVRQLGMNVKMWISAPKTPLFRKLDLRKKEAYRGGFEPIPDVVVFRPQIDGDFRRRNSDEALLQALLAIEVKASERRDKRLTPGEICNDIRKVAAHRDEALNRGAGFYPAVIVLDTAPESHERMTPSALESVRKCAQMKRVGLFYLSTEGEFQQVPAVSESIGAEEVARA